MSYDGFHNRPIFFCYALSFTFFLFWQPLLSLVQDLSYATLFGTALTYGIFFYLASVGNLTSVSALIFLTPIFAMLFSYLFLGEMLTSFQWIGVVLTLVSVVMVIQRESIDIALSALFTRFDKLKPASIAALGNTSNSEPPSS